MGTVINYDPSHVTSEKLLGFVTEGSNLSISLFKIVELTIHTAEYIAVKTDRQLIGIFTPSSKDYDKVILLHASQNVLLKQYK